MLSGEDISRSSHNRKGDELTITKFTTEPISFGTHLRDLMLLVRQEVRPSLFRGARQSSSSACLRQTGRALTPPRKWPFAPTVNQPTWASMAMEISYSKKHYLSDFQLSPHNLSFGEAKRGQKKGSPA